MPELQQRHSGITPIDIEAEAGAGYDPGGDKYLYCIIRCWEERAFTDAVAIGRGGGPVYTIPVNGLALVVSDSPLEEYDSTRANLLDHTRVQELVMREFPLLPVRFGTVARAKSNGQDSPTPGPSEGLMFARQKIRELLSQKHEEFERLLTESEGKVELGLKVLWKDERAIFEEILLENPALGRRRNELVRKPPEVVRFEGVRFGEMVKQALDRKRVAEASRLLAPLLRIASRTVEKPEMVVDRMVVDAAFLVDQSRQEAFDQAVNQLGEELGERVTLKYVGPVPPYNFVNITVNWEELGLE